MQFESVNLEDSKSWQFYTELLVLLKNKNYWFKYLKLLSWWQNNRDYIVDLRIDQSFRHSLLVWEFFY